MNINDRIQKAYAQLRPDQQAAIAFQFATDGNAHEFKMVEDAVPWKICRVMDINYRHSLRSILDMAAYFAIEYWMNKARLLAALMQATESLRQNNAAAAEQALEAVGDCEIWRSVLVQAMETVCAESGIEPGSIWRLAAANPVAAGELWETRPDWVVEMTTALRTLRQPQ